MECNFQFCFNGFKRDCIKDIRMWIEKVLSKYMGFFFIRSGQSLSFSKKRIVELCKKLIINLDYSTFQFLLCFHFDFQCFAALLPSVFFLLPSSLSSSFLLQLFSFLLMQQQPDKNERHVVLSFKTKIHIHQYKNIQR